MAFTRLLASMVAGAGLLVGGLSGVSQAQRRSDAQVCSLGSAAVGQPGTLICKDLRSGATTQAIPLGPTVAAAGGIAASLASRGDRVLVTNQASGAVLFHVGNGFLVNPLLLDTDGEGTLSGALGERGAYVLTGTTLRFFPHGQTKATSARPLLLGDGSAAAVTLTKQFAYVSEKKGSLEAFSLANDGSLGAAAAVSGVSPGVILWPEDERWSDEVARQRIIHTTLLKRVGEPEDIARTVRFLVLDAPYVTGQIIAVDGGRSISL